MTIASPSSRKVRRLTALLLVIALGMFGFGFALVPMYRVFCKVTGLNGKIEAAAATEAVPAIDQSRTITIQFLANTNANLPWDFYPLVTSIKLHPGEVKRISFFARNRSHSTMTVQAIPSVTPGLAAQYIRKTECFCFTQQTFAAGEAREMPVLFHLDKQLPKEYSTVTLSYTMFDAGRFAPRQTQGRIP